MIYLIFKQYPNIMMAAGVFFTFLLTFVVISKRKEKLPTDCGREFAVDGSLSKGKPQGAGLYFIISFMVGCLLFSPIFYLGMDATIELMVYLLCIFLEMITGYLDDRSDIPWGRTKKGLLDLFVSLAVAANFIHYQGSTILVIEKAIEIPEPVMFILIVALCWGMINVTNCADGVDSLSGTLVIVTILSFFIADMFLGKFGSFNYFIVFFIVALAAYLWFNAYPSVVLMGDAGSRAMGVFICITALKSKHPLLVVPFALVIILDGGLGLLKVSVIKITKNKNFMNKIRTPLHDHVRKNLENKWGNVQCVMRFVLIQIIISVATIYIFMR